MGEAMVSAQGFVNRLKRLGLVCRKVRGREEWVCWDPERCFEVKVFGDVRSGIVVEIGGEGELSQARDFWSSATIDDLIKGLERMSGARNVSLRHVYESKLQLYYPLEDWEKALRFIEALTKLKPDFKITNLYGDVLLRIGNRDVSIRQFLEELEKAMKESVPVT